MLLITVVVPVLTSFHCNCGLKVEIAVDDVIPVAAFIVVIVVDLDIERSCFNCKTLSFEGFEEGCY